MPSPLRAGCLRGPCPVPPGDAGRVVGLKPLPVATTGAPPRVNGVVPPTPNPALCCSMPRTHLDFSAQWPGGGPCHDGGCVASPGGQPHPAFSTGHGSPEPRLGEPSQRAEGKSCHAGQLRTLGHWVGWCVEGRASPRSRRVDGSDAARGPEPLGCCREPSGHPQYHRLG